MPSQSGAQHNFMEMIAHDPGKAKEKGVPQSVGEDFVQADKAQGKKFAYGHHKQNKHEDATCTHMNAHAYGHCPDVK